MSNEQEAGKTHTHTHTHKQIVSEAYLLIFCILASYYSQSRESARDGRKRCRLSPLEDVCAPQTPPQ